MEIKFHIKHIRFLLLALAMSFLLLSFQALTGLPGLLEKKDKLDKKIYKIEHAAQIIAGLKAKQKSWDENHLEQKRSPIQSHLDFVSYLEELSQEGNCRTLAIPIEELTDKGSYRLSTERFSLEAKLHNLLKVLHRIEVEDKVGSLNFMDLKKRKVQIGNKKKEILLAELELQRLSK